MKKGLKITFSLLIILLLTVLIGCGKNETAQPGQGAAQDVTVTVFSHTPENTSSVGDTSETAVTEAEEEASETQADSAATMPSETQAGSAAAMPSETDNTSPDENLPYTETVSTTDAFSDPEPSSETAANSITVEEYGEYSDKDHVALYLHTYGHLPSNYVTKKEARKAGWNAPAGNLITVLPGKSIGGDTYTNYEGTLPDQKGRKYYECDINYNPQGKTSGKVTRGPERIVFSNDGLIFYTNDHYQTFEQLY